MLISELKKAMHEVLLEAEVEKYALEIDSRNLGPAIAPERSLERRKQREEKDKENDPL